MNRTEQMDPMDLLLYAAMPYTGTKEQAEYAALDPSVTLSHHAERRIGRRLKRAIRSYERNEAKPKTQTPLAVVKKVALYASVALLLLSSLCGKKSQKRLSHGTINTLLSLIQRRKRSRSRCCRP